MEAVLPIDVQIPSLRIMKDEGLSEDENEKICTPDKSKTWKGGLGKNGYPGGLKTRKGGPGKS